MAGLESAGISLDDVTATAHSTTACSSSPMRSTSLLGAVATQARGPCWASALDRAELRAAAAAATERVKATLEDWRATGKVRAAVGGDASLWTGADEAKWLGWLASSTSSERNSPQLDAFAQEVQRRRLRRTRCCSAWAARASAPEVFAQDLRPAHGHPELHVLDSTDPAQIRAIEARIDLARTLFIVSSKSGTTLEPNILKHTSSTRGEGARARHRPAQHFIAITDPGLEAAEGRASANGFRHIFFGEPSIGGRYSALSDFGLVPGRGHGGRRRPAARPHAAHGARLRTATCRRGQTRASCSGRFSALLGQAGRDKVTSSPRPASRDLGAWLEQLLAESTGKQGKGIIPVDRRAARRARRSTATTACSPTCGSRRARRGAGRRGRRARRRGPPRGAHRASPTATISGRSSSAGRSRRRWPARSSASTRSISRTSRRARSRRASSPTPVREDRRTAAGERRSSTRTASRCSPMSAMREALTARRQSTLAGYLRAHLERLRQATISRCSPTSSGTRRTTQLLQAHPRRGPRSHSAWRPASASAPAFSTPRQAYKGGPNSGVFLQITCDDAADCRSRAEIHLRHREGGAGARRLRRCWPSAAGARCACISAHVRRRRAGRSATSVIRAMALARHSR